MHGESTASSMVNVANTLLDCNHAVAINMGLEDRVQDILVPVSYTNFTVPNNLRVSISGVAGDYNTKCKYAEK
ncbi:hypothetical protein BGU15_18740 [Clostridioides difficile]|nr:hypothetical protein BGU15_18740 [Clostridioides difficile]